MDETRGPTFATGYEHLTLVQRLQRIVYSPRSAFEAIGDEPTPLDWVVPIVFLAVVWVGANYLTLSVLANPELPAYLEKMQELTPEQQEVVRLGREQYVSFGWYMDPVVNSFFSLAAVGLVLLGVARIVFKADVSLRHMLTVKAYASVIAMIELVASTPLVLSAQTPEISFTIGSLLSDGLAATAFGRILVRADLFVLWQVIVLGMGLGITGRIPLNRSVPAVVILWGLWITSGALLSSIVPPPPAAG